MWWISCRAPIEEDPQTGMRPPKEREPGAADRRYVIGELPATLTLARGEEHSFVVAAPVERGPAVFRLRDGRRWHDVLAKQLDLGWVELDPIGSGVARLTLRGVKVGSRKLTLGHRDAGSGQVFAPQVVVVRTVALAPAVELAGLPTVPLVLRSENTRIWVEFKNTGTATLLFPELHVATRAGLNIAKPKFTVNAIGPGERARVHIDLDAKEATSGPASLRLVVNARVASAVGQKPKRFVSKAMALRVNVDAPPRVLAAAVPARPGGELRVRVVDPDGERRLAELWRPHGWTWTAVERTRLGATYVLSLPDEEVTPRSFLLTAAVEDRAAISRAELRLIKGTEARVGEQTVKAWAKQLNDPERRLEAAQALYRAGPAAASVVKSLVRALVDRDPRVRRLAAASLGSLGEVSRSTLATLQQRTIRDPDAEVRAEAAWSLGALQSVEAEKVLRLALRDDAHIVRANAALLLGALPTAAKLSLGALVEALRKDKSERVRAHAALAVGEFLPDAKAKAALDTARSDRVESVRRAAGEALEGRSHLRP